MNPTVARCNTTPIKGLALHHPTSIDITASGVPGDRAFFLVDAATHKMCSNAAHGSLLQVRADFDVAAGTISVTFPDGVTIESDVPGGAPLTASTWGNPVPAHQSDPVLSEAFSRFVGASVLLVRPDNPALGHDDEPVTLVSLASVEELARQGERPEGLDARRFRMTLDLQGCSPHEEDTWAGRQLRIGTTMLRVGVAVPRCVVTQLDPDVGTKDFPTLKVIRNYRERDENGLPFGMYASVLSPGVITVGDAVEVLPD